MRRLQQLRAEYERKGTVPKLNRGRRPKTELTEEEKELLRKAVNESKVVPCKYVITWEDDASRNILAGKEFDEATTENTISVVKDAKRVAWEKYATVLKALNTDKGSQFFANKNGSDGVKGVSEFEQYLAREGVKHITSRRNHPQTNGKEERWFRTYEENRLKFSSFQDFVVWYRQL